MVLSIRSTTVLGGSGAKGTLRDMRSVFKSQVVVSHVGFHRR